MKDRINRLMAVRKLITFNRIKSQEELMRKLEKKGFRVTQATLSRDLKFLKVSRRYDEKGRLYYVMPESLQREEAASQSPLRFDEGFVSLEFSGSLGVLKTLPGYASSFAIRIDRAAKFEILGTVAGDDTILIIPREGVQVKDIRSSLKMIFPDLEEKL